MATLKELRDERLRKLEDLQKLGVNPYPAKANRTHDTQQILTQFNELEDKVVTTVGRIVSVRKFGKIAFVVVKDDGDEIQLFWRSEEHTSELQSLMRISYAVFCLKKNKKSPHIIHYSPMIQYKPQIS